MTTTTTEATVSSAGFTYRAQCRWAQWPANSHVDEVVAVATDSHGRVFVFNRGDHPVSVFDSQGQFLFSWGEQIFSRAHGITIGPDDSVYCTDDFGHSVKKFAPDGRLLMTLGTAGVPSDTGATCIDYRTIRYAGPPFHFPTNLAVAGNGDLYISDGYGNARIHRFRADGRLLSSWGSPGSGPGQFHVPHGIAIGPNNTIYVADRENNRVQRFSAEGEYLSEWTDLARPCEVAIGGDGKFYIAELGYRAGMWPGTQPPHPDATGGRVSILDSQGQVLARIGGGNDPSAAGDFYAPHDIWVDEHNDLYVAEVTKSASGNQQAAESPYHTLQKFSVIQGGAA